MCQWHIFAWYAQRSSRIIFEEIIWPAGLSLQIFLLDKRVTIPHVIIIENSSLKVEQTKWCCEQATRRTYSLTQARAHTHRHTHTSIVIHMCTYVYNVNKHVQAHFHTYALKCMHTQTHTRTYTHVHARTRTYTHTHITCEQYTETSSDLYYTRSAEYYLDYSSDVIGVRIWLLASYRNQIGLQSHSLVCIGVRTHLLRM